MLQQGEILRTWRLAQPPDVEGPIDSEPLPDHRLAYLDYEGPVSGGRGTVQQWDAGTSEIIESMADRVVVRLAGRRLGGVAALEQSQSGPTWLFQWVLPPAASQGQ